MEEMAKKGKKELRKRKVFSRDRKMHSATLVSLLWQEM